MAEEKKKTTKKATKTAVDKKTETKVAEKKKAEPKKATAKTVAKKVSKVEKKLSKKAASKVVKITQIGSPIGRKPYQRATLIGLGLNKMHKTSILEDTVAVRGMINKVKHLLHVEDAA